MNNVNLPPLPYPQIPGNDYTAADMRAYAEQAVRETLAAQRPLFIYDPVADGVTPVWKWPEEPTPAMIEAMRAGSRKDWPSDELCRVRYAALRSAALASAPVAGEAVSWQVRRTDGSPLACWETCTRDLYNETLATGRYNGLEGAPPCEVRALAVINISPQASAPPKENNHAEGADQEPT